MNNNRNLYILIAILIVMNVATISYLLGANLFNNYRGFGMMGGNRMINETSLWDVMEEHMEEVHSEVNYNKPVAETHTKTYDFGQISKSEGVLSTTFEIENHGKKPLEIGEISTSCGCTTAEVEKTTLGFNEETELTVYFDPNFHEEPEGRFTRSVFVETNDPELPEMQFDIYVEILD